MPFVIQLGDPVIQGLVAFLGGRGTARAQVQAQQAQLDAAANAQFGQQLTTAATTFGDIFSGALGDLNRAALRAPGGGAGGGGRGGGGASVISREFPGFDTASLTEFGRTSLQNAPDQVRSMILARQGLAPDMDISTITDAQALPIGADILRMRQGAEEQAARIQFKAASDEAQQIQGIVQGIGSGGFAITDPQEAQKFRSRQQAFATAIEDPINAQHVPMLQARQQQENAATIRRLRSEGKLKQVPLPSQTFQQMIERGEVIPVPDERAFITRNQKGEPKLNVLPKPADTQPDTQKGFKTAQDAAKHFEHNVHTEKDGTKWSWDGKSWKPTKTTEDPEAALFIETYTQAIKGESTSIEARRIAEGAVAAMREYRSQRAGVPTSLSNVEARFGPMTAASETAERMLNAQTIDDAMAIADFSAKVAQKGEKDAGRKRLSPQQADELKTFYFEKRMADIDAQLRALESVPPEQAAQADPIRQRLLQTLRELGEARAKAAAKQ